MFCKNCGNKLEDNARFCNACGANVLSDEAEAPKEQETIAENEVAAPAEEAPVATAEAPVATAEAPIEAKVICKNCGAEVVGQNPFCTTCGTPVNSGAEAKPVKTAKKPKLKKGIVIPVVAAVVALSVIAGVMGAPYVSNFVTKTFMSSEKYFTHVVKKNVEGSMGVFAESYNLAKKYLKEGVTATGTATIEVGDGLPELIKDVSGGEISSEDMSLVTKVLDAADKIKYDYKATYKDHVSAIDMGVEVGGVDFGNFNYYVDLNEMEFCFGMPEYNPQYIGVNLSDEMNYEAKQSFAIINGLYDVLPDSKVLETLITRYAVCVAENIDDVDESKEKLSAGDVSQKVTKLSAEIDGDTMLKIANAFLKEVKNDKEIENIVSDAAEAFNVPVPDYKSAVDELLDDLKDSDMADSEESFDFILYVDGKGELLGFGVEVDGAEFKAYTIKSGNKFGTFIGVDAGAGKVALEGGGKTNNGKASGEYNVKAMGMALVDITFNKVDVNLLERGIFNGELKVAPAKSLETLAGQFGGDIPAEIFDISLAVKSNSTSFENEDAEVTLNYGKNLCLKIAANTSVKAPEKINKVSDYLNITNEYDLAAWAGSFDVSKLTSKLEKLGLPEEMMGEIEKGFTGGTVEEPDPYGLEGFGELEGVEGLGGFEYGLDVEGLEDPLTAIEID